MRFRPLTIALLWLLADASAAAARPRIDIVVVGDVGLNRTRVKVRADGVDVWGKVVPFEEMSRGIRSLLTGDINFANLETVITDRNNIPHVDKAFNFRSHPKGVEHLIRIGLNLFSLANNHSMDYGADGARATLSHLRRLSKKYKKMRFAGIGMNIDEATRPAVFKLKGRRFAFSAVGNGSPARSRRPGVASVISYRKTLERLRKTRADFRILSIHDGKERQNFPRGRQIRIAREAIARYRVHLVVCHHAHVVEGVEKYKHGLIFYGLGNFLLKGARNMGAYKELRIQKDFGLLARITIDWSKRSKRFVFHSIKVIPIYDMHFKPHPFRDQDQIAKRLDALNSFSQISFINKRAPRGFGRNRGFGLTFTNKGTYGLYQYDGLPSKKKKPSRPRRAKSAKTK